MTLQHELVGTNAVEAAAEELEKKRLLPALPRGQDGKLTTEGRMLRQEVVRNLSADLKVIFEVRSKEVDLVSVSFTDPDPRLAQELPNTLITNYIDRISEQIVTNLTSSRDFLQTKVDEANTRLAELTRKRIDFETKYAGMLPDNPGALQQEIQRIATDTDTVRRQQALAKQKLDQIRVILGRSAAPEDDGSAAAPEGVGSATESALSAEREYKDATQDLARLQDQQQQYQRSLDESRTLLHMTEKHPRVVALRKQIDALDKRITEFKVLRLPDLEKHCAKVGPACGPRTAIPSSTPPVSATRKCFRPILRSRKRQPSPSIRWRPTNWNASRPAKSPSRTS